MHEHDQDEWLKQPDLLRQPKKVIGDYVEAHDISVPQRFNDLNDAVTHVRQKGSILLRSEHPDEYNGPSGLGKSYLVDAATIERGKSKLSQIVVPFNIMSAIRNLRIGGNYLSQNLVHGSVGQNDLVDIILSGFVDDPAETLRFLDILQLKNADLWLYSHYKGTDFKAEVGRSSFSIWEHVPGRNVTIVADDTIDGQYHVMVASRSERLISGGIVSAAGAPIKQRGPHGGERLVDFVDATQAIALYEKVRNLGSFASCHCPIMEFQVDRAGDFWFLQYHRSRDFSPTTERLDFRDFPAQNGWLQAVLSRGSTDGTETQLTVAVAYPNTYARGGLPEHHHEEASLFRGANPPLSEVLSLSRTAFIIDNTAHGAESELYADMSSQHSPRSRWFKPQSAFHIGGQSLIPIEHRRRMVSASLDGSLMRIAIDVVSDGTSGFVRLFPGAEPVLADW